MSRGFLLDTNVPSELTRPQPEPRVTRWLEDTDDDLMYFSVISIGEVCKGLPFINSARTIETDQRRRSGGTAYVTVCQPSSSWDRRKWR